MMKDVSDQLQRNLLSTLRSDFQAAEQDRDALGSRWDEAEMQYESEYSEAAKAAAGDKAGDLIFVPKTKIIVNRLHVGMMQHFLGPGASRLCDLEAATPATSDEAETIDVLAEWLHAKLDIQLDPREVIEDVTKSALVYQHGVCQAGYNDADDTLELFWRPNRTVCWDPKATTTNDISYVCVEHWLTADELWQRKMDGLYENVEDVLSSPADDGYDCKESAWTQSLGSPQSAGKDPTRWLYRVVEYWGPLHLIEAEELMEQHRRGEHTMAEDVVATFFDNRVLLRLEDNPYADFYKNPKPFEKLPFFIARALHRIGMPSGYSTVLEMRSLQRETNKLRNERRWAVDQELNRRVYFDKNRMIDKNNFMDGDYCGAVGVDGNPRNAVYDSAPHTTTQEMVREEAIVDSDLQELTGVTDYHQGINAQGMQKTATGVMQMLNRGDVSINQVYANIGQTFIEPVCKFCALALANMGDLKELKRILKRTERSSPDLMIPDEGRLVDGELPEEINFKAAAGYDTVGKPARIQGLQFASQGIAQLVQAAPELGRKILGLLEAQKLREMGYDSMANDVEDFTRQLERARPPSADQVPGMENPGYQLQQASGRPMTPQEAPGR
jgi:hypothetical protein